MEDVEEIRQADQAPASLDKTVGDDGDTAFGDLLAADQQSPEEEVTDGGVLPCRAPVQGPPPWRRDARSPRDRTRQAFGRSNAGLGSASAISPTSSPPTAGLTMRLPGSRWLRSTKREPVVKRAAGRGS